MIEKCRHKFTSNIYATKCFSCRITWLIIIYCLLAILHGRVYCDAIVNCSRISGEYWKLTSSRRMGRRGFKIWGWIRDPPFGARSVARLLRPSLAHCHSLRSPTHEYSALRFTYTEYASQSPSFPLRSFTRCRYAGPRYQGHRPF